jgi:hypothetical protein
MTSPLSVVKTISPPPDNNDTLYRMTLQVTSSDEENFTSKVFIYHIPAAQNEIYQDWFENVVNALTESEIPGEKLPSADPFFVPFYRTESVTLAAHSSEELEDVYDLVLRDIQRYIRQKQKVLNEGFVTKVVSVGENTISEQNQEAAAQLKATASGSGYAVDDNLILVFNLDTTQPGWVPVSDFDSQYWVSNRSGIPPEGMAPPLGAVLYYSWDGGPSGIFPLDEEANYILLKDGITVPSQYFEIKFGTVFWKTTDAFPWPISWAGESVQTQLLLIRLST